MATHSSVLAWRIPGTGEPGGLLSMGSHRVGHDWSDLAAAAAWKVRTSWNGNKLSTQSGGLRGISLSKARDYRIIDQDNSFRIVFTEATIC